MKRRTFITRLTGSAVGCGIGHQYLRHHLGDTAAAQDAIDFVLPDQAIDLVPVPALFYECLEGKQIICRLCPRECCVADQERGYCGVRENQGGKYFTLVHSRLCAVHVDPIEKKPLYHFLPGTTALSLATAGCNMECRFCQNWQISQFRPEQVNATDAPPTSLLRAAREHQVQSIAYTYSEPTVFYEYILDTARLTAPKGIRNVVISNGYISEPPLRQLAPFLAAYKVDLKGFSDQFYRTQCNATCQRVLDTLVLLRRLELWFEIVILIIPTLNDDETTNRLMFKWIVAELGPDIPIHLSRFHPTYKIRNLPRTPVSTLERIYNYAREAGLNYVYLGNTPGHKSESTYCPSCGSCVIERFGYVIGKTKLIAGACESCGFQIPGVWS